MQPVAETFRKPTAGALNVIPMANTATTLILTGVPTRCSLTGAHRQRFVKQLRRDCGGCTAAGYVCE